MIAEILATGDEIRTGALIDSNSAYIAQQLEEAGVRVVRHHCVGDDLDMLASIFKEIAGRSDVAVVSGGLGPTADDLTAEAAAKAAGAELMSDPKALKSIEAFFAARNLELTARNKMQALLPAGAACILNPVGTAPGFRLRLDNCLFFFVPGVPHEMRHMMTAHVVPHIINTLSEKRSYYVKKTISSFGLGESVTAERLSGFEGGFADIKLGLRAKFPEIQVKLYGSGADKDELIRRLADASGWVVDRIGGHVFSENGESMGEVVGALLKQQHKTLAIAESCTGGLISDMITDVPGSSDYFLFAGTTYANQAKEEIIGVSPSTLATYGAVHEQTAKEMAEGVKRISGASYGLSTSGIAGPDGGTDEKPVGTVCIGLATPRKSVGRRFRFYNYDRLRNKQIFAMTALDLLRRDLLGME